MKKKKIIPLLLALSLVFSGVIPVYAASNDSKGMEKALVSAKKVITIPSDYKKFSYNFMEQWEEKGEPAVWRFNWAREDGKGGISATVDEQGILTSYNKYDNEKKQGISTLNYESGQKTAADFLNKAAPQQAKEMKLTDTDGKSSVDSYWYHFSLYKNEIPVDSVRASLLVDKFSNEVISYRMEGDSTLTGVLPDKNGVIGEDAAKALWLTKGAVQLKYFSGYDSKGASIFVFPAYALKDENFAIDAKTGETVSLEKNVAGFAKEAGGEKAMADQGGNRESPLTEVEIAAIEKVNQLLSKEDAEKKAQAYLSQLGYSGYVKSAALEEDYAEKGKFYWSLYLEQGTVRLNAKTGELITFYINEDESKKNTAISEKMAQIQGEAYIESVLNQDKWKDMKLIENKNTALRLKNYAPENYSFQYERMVNGVPFDSNGVQVTVNKWTGKVESYSLDWYDNVTFPSIDKAVTPEKAFDVFNKTGKMQLVYVKDDKNENRLVYQFENHIEFYVNALDLKKCDFGGKPFVEAGIPRYTDIAGHWAEKTINTLRENGYYVEGTKFFPNEKISQEAFLRYLYAPIQASYDSSEFYELLDDKGILLKNEQAPKKELTRQGAAKLVIRYLGQEKAASHGNIYKNMFTDTVDKNYMGYAALCNAFQIIKGDKKGRFNGNNPITNGEAATIIYRTLEAK
ncbi:MAG: S-layer homology domain-containing protein [Anaerovorax sp.]